MKTKKIISFLVALTLTVVSLAGLAPATRAEASVTDTDIVYDGEGSVEKTLANGKKARVELNNSVLSITVGGEKYGYYTTSCVGTFVVSDDDLLHIFWHTGQYYVYDLYESEMYVLAGASKVSGKKISYYAVSDFSDTGVVKGTSAPNVAFHSCIIDGTYFYMYGQTGKKYLMTRKEFENIINPEPEETAEPEQTQAPTPKASTAEPVATIAPTEAPTPEPTQAPTAEPTKEPVATTAPTEAPAAAVVEDSGNAIGDDSVANGGNGQSAPVTISGDGNVVNIDQSINIIHNEVIGDGNSVSNENSDTDVTDNTSVVGDSNNTSTEADAELQEVDNTVAGDGNAVVQEPQQVVTETEAETQQSGDNDTAEDSAAAAVAVAAPSVPPVVAVTEDTVAAVNPSKEVVKIVEVIASAKPSTAAVAATPAPVSSSVDTSSSKGKCHPRVVTSGKRIKLFSKKNKLWGWLTFNKKKGVIRWNGLKRKNVINAGFIKKSWRIGVILRNGKVLSIPYRNGKVKVIGKKAKTFRRTKWGFIKSYVRKGNNRVVGISGR